MTIRKFHEEEDEPLKKEKTEYFFTITELTAEETHIKSNIKNKKCKKIFSNLKIMNIHL